MLRFDIISVVPELINGFFSYSIMRRAAEKKYVEFNLINLRDFAEPPRFQVDDYQFGGGAGMVLMVEPLAKAIEKLKTERNYDEIIYLTPDGERFNQKMANSMSLGKNYMLICGHYKGIDHRIREHYITKEISVGDYVLSGGELAAAVVADAVSRLIPGVLNNETSALTDSFQDNLLAPPVYTRPENFNGWKVPEILLGGNHKLIDEWRFQQSIERTKKIRPDLFNEDR